MLLDTKTEHSHKDSALVQGLIQRVARGATGTCLVRRYL